MFTHPILRWLIPLALLVALALTARYGPGAVRGYQCSREGGTLDKPTGICMIDLDAGKPPRVVTVPG